MKPHQMNAYRCFMSTFKKYILLVFLSLLTFIFIFNFDQPSLSLIISTPSEKTLAEAIDLYLINKIEAAITEFDNAILLDPENAEAHFYKGAIFEDRNSGFYSLEKALVEYSQAISKKAEFIDAYSGSRPSEVQLNYRRN
jgi:tetratricopeptide (TPR) repeat protein